MGVNNYQTILRIELNDQICYSEHHLMVPEHFYCWVAGSFKLDPHLTWNNHIDAVCKKLVFIISRLSRLRHVLAPRILMYIYQGIIQSRFDYAITIWAFTYKYNSSKV